MSTDLMIDIETLGKNNNSHVLSVGMVWWDKSHPDEEAISCPILIPSLVQPKSIIDSDTVKWWMQQERDAQDILIGNHSRESNELVAGKIKSAAESARRIWAKDPDFDCVILSNFIHNYLGAEWSWPFWKNRSVRTVMDIVPDCKDLVMDGTAHNALADAQYQTKQMQHAFKWLNTRT